MSLTIGIQQSAGGPLLERIALDEPVVQFNDEEDGGYYWYLYPVFTEIVEKTGQMIDLYGDAEFRGEHLQELRRALEEARWDAEKQPDQWTVYVGTACMPNATPPMPPFEVYKDVERTKLIQLLDSLLALIDRATQNDRTLILIGD
jgi:hypothetical protein